MIVPPFFGLYLPYKEREIYGLKHSYLANDVLTYIIPTKKVNLSYVATDVLVYTTVDDPMIITWLADDILSYTIPTNKIAITYCGVDALCYDPPPDIPLAPLDIVALDGDSLVYLTWTEPYDNRSTLLDYVVQYSPHNSGIWTTVNDGVNLNTLLTIDNLINNTAYDFRIAAINSVGTGVYGMSNMVTPSGGDDSYCSLKLLIKPEAADIASVIDLSCNECPTSHIGIISDDTNYRFGSRSLLFDGQSDIANNPNQFPYFTTAHHYRANVNMSKHDNTYWSFIDNFTIEMWIKPATLPATNTRTIMSAYSQQSIDNTNLGFWKIYLDTNNKLYYQFRADYYNPSIEARSYHNLLIDTGTTLSSASFTHIALCRSNGYIRIYINGIEIYKTYFVHPIPILTTFMIIGADHTSNNTQYDTFNIDRIYTTLPFAGNIDDILISNTSKYRRNFTPAQYTKTINCIECNKPSAVTNLAVTVVSGVY